MRFAAAVCLLAVGVSELAGQTVDVGTGAPNEYIRVLFQNAFHRGTFRSFAALPPAGSVRRYGATGLIQEFNDSTRSSGRMALVKANAIADEDNPYGDVYQIQTDVFAYYGTVGVATAGYPTQDTQFCPSAPCSYQLFDRRHALFAYSAGANDPQNVTVRDPFYTRWIFFGGISSLGPAETAETAVVGSFGGAATQQRFREGVLYNVTAGSLTGRLVSVRQPIFSLYAARGAHTGALGYPTGDEVTVAGGRRRQTFEGGSIEYDETNPPAVRTPVRAVMLRPSSTPVRLNLGETVALEAVVYGADDSELVDRPVTFTTTNGRVISVQSSALRAAVRAVGSGTARVTATSEGRVSAPVEFVVTAQCCAVGEGAPAFSQQQAFQDAVARNRLNLRLPGPERVRRAGAGLVQEFQDAAGGARYLLALSDNSAQAFVVSGALLNRYEESGGPAGLLGYPTSDMAATGRQSFERGTLAGNPLRVVSGSILARWAQAGFEGGPMRSPVGDAAAVITFKGASGAMQPFQGGWIAGPARAAFGVTGPIAERYASLGAASGALGFPIGEEFGAEGKRRQEFEGGALEWGPGEVEAQVILRERRPAVGASPAAVIPGTRIRLTISGFPEGATVRVSQAGQPDFLVQTATGAYSWDQIIPPTAPVGAVRVRAVDVSNPSITAEASYTIRTAAEARVQLSKVSGDTQTGVPGSLLALPLRVALRDEAGTPISGLSVRFNASPGAAVTPESVVTDAAGVAEARLRLPVVDGVAVVSVEAARQVVTFSARVAGSAVFNFPRLTSQENPLVAAAASILRFHQNRGDLGQPNGLADVATVEDFLRRACFSDAQGTQVCDGYLPGQTPNLWRLPAFVGGRLEVLVERPEEGIVRALVTGGSPALLALGSGYVVATGIGRDGGIEVHDPLPGSGRTRLEPDAKITAVFRFVPRTPSANSFVVTSTDAGIEVVSPAGECGIPVMLGSVRVRACEGDAPEYQIELQGAGPVLRAVVTDLVEGGSRTEVAGGQSAAFRAWRPSALLVVEPQHAALAVRGAVLNAATFTADIAPGGLASIFGSGLARAGGPTTVVVGGRPASVVAALPFQVNVQVPPETAPGTHIIRIDSPHGRAEQQVDVRAVAPAIFRIGPDFRRGTVVNRDGTVNSPASPARRGEPVVIYCTGLGGVSPSGGLSIVSAPVAVVLGGQELRPSYAGLTPGFIGLYQINLVIPVTFPPGLNLELMLRQGGVDSIPVEISVQ